MLITVRRIKSDRDATLSAIFVDDEFQCFGLEDEYREHKVPGETRIPEGVYPVGVRSEGGFYTRYHERFSWHAGMLQVMDVPGFEYILIHIGNTDEDTAGCLLVGQGATCGDELTVHASTAAYRALYARVYNAAVSGNLMIEYIDEDR